ncbi:MAG: cell division protein FtsA [Alphaproteobacteria bacterium]
MQNSLLTNKKILAAIDLGSTKTSCMIAECDLKTETLHVLGVGQHASKGIKNNVIVDMEAVENVILNVVNTAEKMAGLTIKDVVVNISGEHLISEVINIRLKIPSRPITDEDLNHMISQATHVDEKKDFEIIHAIPLSYTIDGRKGIQDPRGMIGQNIVCSLHIITGDKGPVQTLVNCIHRCHLGIQAIVASSIASSFATLGDDETELGVTLIDIGGGTTDIALFVEGQVIHTESLQLGGRHISSDIAHGLSTSLAQAERIKTLHGTAVHTMADDHVTLSVAQMGDDAHESPIKKTFLTSIIQARLEEIFEIIKDRLAQSNMHIIASKRVVLTGGGSQMPGIKDLASRVLGKKVRLGKPSKLQGLSESALNPSFATCTGLLIFAMKDMYQQQETLEAESWFDSVKTWVKTIF